MDSVFSEATVFNGDVSKWDTAKVANMDSMFFKASKFNQDLSKWNTAKVPNKACSDFATNSSCPIDVDPGNAANKGKQTCKATLENCVIDTELS